MDPHQRHTYSVLEVTDTCLRFRPIISAESTKTSSPNSSPVRSKVEVQLQPKSLLFTITMYMANLDFKLWKTF